MKTKELEDVFTFASMVAHKQGWQTSLDRDLYTDLCQGLKENWNRYSYFLCPCRDSYGSREKDSKAICPCIWAREDIETYGHCFCSLFWSKDFASSGKMATSIPDRDDRA